MTDLTVHTYGLEGERAPTLLLMHGFSDSGPAWADAIRRWSGSYRILAPDARGHGESPRFTAEELGRPRYEVMADDGIKILERAVGRTGAPVLVVGHSMGAEVAALVTEWRPDLVAAVVLEDPPWRDPGTVAELDRQPARVHAGADGSLVLGVTLCESELAERAAAQGRARPGWPAVELLPWARAKTRTDPTMARARRRQLPTPWARTAAAMAAPTLLVTGDGAAIVSQRIRARLHEVAPSIRVVVVPGADHSVRRDQGELFHQAVDPFLASMSHGRRAGHLGWR